LFNRRFDRARQTRRALVQSQPRMELIELPHLSVCSPPQIALPRVSEGVGIGLEAAPSVEARGQLVGERLVVDEPIVTGRADGLLVEPHRVKLATFDARDLRSHECRTVFESLRTVLRPNGELIVLGYQSLEMLPLPIGRSEIPHCRAGQRAIEARFRRF
jgi:hypothetical protein